MKTYVLAAALMLATIDLHSQEAAKDTSTVSFGAYADAYYSWYSNGSDVAIQEHDCIGAYHNNFGLNVAQFTTAYSGDRLRGVATIHFGDIPAITWAGTYRNVQEANAGVRLAKGLWLDVGFFKTHVGTESFLPKNNLMSIITLATFYGPFYQSGARLSYDTESEWHFELHAINGYNLHVDNNDFKTFGLLVSKPFGEHVYVSYSNMLGQERVGQHQDAYLVYQNAYANFFYDRFSLQIGGDVATANVWKITPGNTKYWQDPLYAGLITAKYEVLPNFSVAFRGEVFSDRDRVNSGNLQPMMIPNTTTSLAVVDGGINIYGGTFGLEYAPSDIGFIRLESRTLWDSETSGNNYPDGFNARSAGRNPMLESRTQIICTAGFYFDKSFKFAR